MTTNSAGWRNLFSRPRQGASGRHRQHRTSPVTDVAALPPSAESDQPPWWHNGSSQYDPSASWWANRSPAAVSAQAAAAGPPSSGELDAQQARVPDIDAEHEQNPEAAMLSPQITPPPAEWNSAAGPWTQERGGIIHYHPNHPEYWDSDDARIEAAERHDEEMAAAHFQAVDSDVAQVVDRFVAEHPGANPDDLQVWVGEVGVYGDWADPDLTDDVHRGDGDEL